MDKIIHDVMVILREVCVVQAEVQPLRVFFDFMHVLVSIVRG